MSNNPDVNALKAVNISGAFPILDDKIYFSIPLDIFKDGSVDRWLPVSGWSYEHGKTGHKPMRRAVPSGRVYFLEILDGNINPADLWLKSICTLAQDINDGFGLVVLGIWFRGFCTGKKGDADKIAAFGTSGSDDNSYAGSLRRIYCAFLSGASTGLLRGSLLLSA